jgi:RasGEF domain/RasGEF N-terminal motif
MKAKPARTATIKSKLSDGPPRPSAHTRPFSFSTVNDKHQTSAELEDGALRIVIDRSATSRPKTTEDLVLPTLNIPIPHYRMGKPHFSVQGTPILRSSAYTRTSEGMSENTKPVSPPKQKFLSPEQARANMKSLSKSHPSDTFTSPDGAVSDISRDSTRLADSAADYSYKEPINPEVFDKLASVKDDECVVRYSQRTGAITAATPARIVAQISSEAFMDYDLVSDFFLTFRAYLSTEDLLSLLLARLHWAINRLEDDGRIIRIRTFAALRHWILNYFVDDFVVNRKLRVQFCNQINEMYREVRQRTGGGVSDMKILLDLKRCWNGRCSLYWDSTDFVVDTQQEADIVPGGIFGSRDPSLTQLDLIADQESKNITDTFQNKASASKTGHGSAVAARAPRIHDQPSISIPGAPVSPTSEQSLQPASCSLPARAFKRSPPPEANARGPYPVSVQLRKQNASPNPLMSMKDSQRRLSNAHKRSCSTSDSIRDRGSTNSLSRPVFLVSPHAGSLIRGNVYPPAAPFVDVIAPESPPSRSRLTVPAMGMPVTIDGSSKPGSPVNPAMKNLMGSIRRALSSKQTGTNSASSVEEISRSPPSLRGKTSGLPLNMTRSSDTLRDKKSAPVVRHHLRIDLLCAAASQSYQQAQAKASQDSFVNPGLGLSISDIHEGSASQNSLGSRDFSIEAGDVRYILTQDDVDFGMVVTDNAGGETTTVLERGVKGDVSAADFDYTTAGMMSMPLLPTERTVERKDSSLDIRRRSNSVDTALARKSKEQEHSRAAELVKLSDGARGQSRMPKLQHHRHNPSAADSTSARSQQSYTGQSVLKHGTAPSVDASVNSISTKGSRRGMRSQAAGHTLRRRPGGNLRNIENVHDLAQGVRRQSTGSLTTRSESVGSLLVMGGSRAAGSKQRRPTPQTIQHPVSLMRTHSSQHLRPSFEAAISGFSTIPDDDDCGLEATLLKLEGRYERASRQVTNTRNIEDDEEQTPLPELLPLVDHQHKGHDQPSQSKPVQLPVSSRPSHPRLRQPSSFSRTRKPGPTSISTRSGRSKGSAARSEESYSSIPLLERGLFDDSMKERRLLPSSNLTTSTPRPVFEDVVNVKTEQDVASPHPSIELVEKTDSMGRIPQGGTFPDPQTDPQTGPGATPADGSFLLDEDDDLTDLSSEMSMDMIDHSEAERPVISSPSAPGGTTNLDHELLTHPLAHPPSPAVSFHQVITSVPPMNPMMYQQKPLTPQPSPTQGVMPESSQVSLSQILPRRKSTAVASATVTTSAGHIPFVLACESEVLAQQLTLVEKAALSEIEWSDLVDMKWDNKSPNILNWVEYLAGKDHKGIDIVITRFNIVVKWVVSEIVMTQNINERAQAITKYIHIAVHAKLLHNYATMLQITIALTSVDCSRLKATWDLVPDLEQARLKEMETLIQPIRNFHDLRIEMETANLQDGCIPFVGKQNSLVLTGMTKRPFPGIYIHDLTYNAQKPSRIANTGNGEPLVNFERYRTAATIVKSLLRLIDASSKYDFPPIPGIIERCLWMAALSDEKITALSKSIE